MRPILRKQTILDIGVANASEQEVLKCVFDVIKKDKEKLFIVTPNPEMIVYAHHHPEFKLRLNSADIALCDGTGLFVAAKFLRKPIQQRITGADFMEKLCEESAKQAVTVGLLGGGVGIAEKTRDCLIRKYPGLQVVFATSDWDYKSYTTHTSYKTYIDIVFVAFGHPKQEEWISSHLDELPVQVAMGVGGAFDYISGNVPRAPYILRALGLEWLYRLIVQPWRWKRQLALIEFVWLVFQARLSPPQYDY